NAIVLQDKAMVSRAPGVGPKVALRIVNELKDKVPAAALTSAPLPVTGSGAAASLQQQANGGPAPFSEAISALINLGYAPLQANAAISAASSKATSGAKTEDLIRLGLKEIASRA